MHQTTVVSGMEALVPHCLAMASANPVRMPLRARLDEMGWAAGPACARAGGASAMLIVLGCTTSQRTSEERAVDADLEAKVESALIADPRVYARHVDVSVDRGVVHLGGYIWTDSELRFVKADAASVPGVLGVSDQTELMRGGISGTSR